ncbi:protein AMBP-like [Tachyglossus aculeatus]|uniref:protein AMBP-like n=1 Tax=Tachyglossus aculeatus TaxID=9261 RepID=UPI0018F5125F|nr:protein AMBP-like [Tachyglossus aculeatus]
MPLPGSSGGNAFSSEMEGLSRCSPRYQELYPKGASACRLPVERGPCRAPILSWRYDPQHQAFDSFFYGGCGGNGNRFSSPSLCIQTCVTEKGKSGAQPDRNEKVVSDVDEGFITAIFCSCPFAVASVIGLTLFFLQKKKQKSGESRGKELELE